MTIRSLPRAPILGNARAFRRDKIALLERVRHELGDVGAFHLGPRKVVVVTAPELARQILVEQADAFEKGPTFRRLARPVFGDGLIAAPSALHKWRRRLVQPAFQPKRMAEYLPAMLADVERALAGWPDGARLELCDEMMTLTLRIIGRTLFSVDLVDEAREVRDAIELLQHHVTDLMRAVVPLPLAVPTPRNRRVQRALTALDGVIYRMIAERRSATGAGRDDLLQRLVDARDPETGAQLDDRAVRDEAMTLFVAGHETTAFALAWTWLLLCQHPEAYDRLVAEVDGVLADRPPRTVEELDRLAFTQQVLKESLRLFPPGHTIGRVATRPVRLGEHVLPKGGIVLVSVLLLQRRPDLFPEPLVFRPERFVDESALPKMAWLPFGAGPRVCIGGHFAFTEMTLVMARLAQRVRFRLEPGQTIVPEMLVTLRPTPGVRVTVHTR